LYACPPAKPSPPESWDDLLHPSFKNHLVIAHPASSGTAYATLMTVPQFKGENTGWDYLKQFHRYVWQSTNSGAAPTQHVGQGEAAVGIIFSHDVITQIEKRLPLVLRFAQGGWAGRSAAWLSSRAPSTPHWQRRGSTRRWSPQHRSLGPSTPPIRRQPLRALKLQGRSCCKPN
jgi:ABC-type Fe3+ transport system substrate-binding protein